MLLTGNLSLCFLDVDEISRTADRILMKFGKKIVDIGYYLPRENKLL